MTTPKLRFKEFDGDWTNCTLKDFTTFAKGKGISKADITEDGENFCIRYGELYTMYGHVIDKIRSKTNVSKSDSVLSKANDVIIPASGETQIDIATASCVLHDDIILSGDLNIVSHQENGVWLAYYLSSAKKLEIAQLAQGNSVVHLYSSQLKELKINKPSKQEQTKIASFLSAVDEKISQLTQKQELLFQYKQGMMQKLFSQQIRFKADDGSEFGEWEEKELHQIFQIKAGGDIDKSSVSEIKTSEFSYPIFANSDKNKGFYGWANKFKYKEAVTVTGRGNLGIAVARTEPFYPIVRLLILLPLVKQNLKFFEEQINLLDIVSESTGVPQLTAPQLSKYKVNVPCLEEQTKIANFLTAIDQKIEVVAQQIEQAKQWKKGLLQQMFV